MRVLLGALALWLAGMVIGSVVFAVPALKAAAPIPYFASNPFITLPIIVTWAFLARWLSRSRIVASPSPYTEGLRTGVVFALVNLALDRVVVVGLLHAGADFYSWAGPWLAYATALLVPWIVGYQESRRRRAVQSPAQ